jgi:hypothetical protein
MSIICEIECQTEDNADFCDANNLKLKLDATDAADVLNADYIHAMIWRWFPIRDSLVDVFSSRDTDSYLIQREVDSVNVWLQSNKVGHIMRDHPWHGTTILGGMWGFHSARNRVLAKQIFDTAIDKKVAAQYNQGRKSPKGSDQFFLTQYVYPHISGNSVTHDSYLCSGYNRGSPFPTQRIGDCYIGGVAGCNVSVEFRECPKNCRPAEHQDWTYC